MTISHDLASLLAEGGVSVDPSDLDAHSHDHKPESLIARRAGADGALPDAVVRPRSIEEVVTVLRWADENGTPIVAFGAGSGVLGGIGPRGGVIVDTRGLDWIGDVDETSRLVTVGAGVMGPDFARSLGDGGYMLGHEPQSVDISTVGGWVATKACGQLSAHFGGIEDLVAGLVAVLPGGRVARSKTVPRRAAGPDVASLMMGSEGAFGIVVEVTLRVSPVPTVRADRCVRFEHMADGVAACRRLIQSELRPTLARLYDAEDSALFLRSHPDEEVVPLLLLSFDGADSESRATEAVGLSGGREGDAALVGHWWTHRNDAVSEFKKLAAGEGLLGPHAAVETMEVAGTWTILRDLYHSMKEALGPLADFVGCHVSHVYRDGACLYFTLGSACADEENARSTLTRWWEAGMSTCLAAGGSISHHHGIGRVKAPWLPAELDGWYDVLKSVKRAVDPKGIMNPGVLGL